MDLDNIQRKYGLPAPLPVVQNGKFAPRFPLNLEHRGDDVFQFGGKYIGEIENIYDLLYKILTNQEIDASLALPYAIKITEDKLYVRDKTNSEWILIFDITKPNFPKEIELYELIYKAITHQVIGEDTSYPGQFKIEENILYVRDKDNLTWTQIGDVTKEFLGATEATQDILDQVNEILTEVQELKTELNRQIATTNETLTTALQAANEAMTSAQSINIRTFNSVEEMKASNTLKAGALAKTQGFYTTGDGGGADYVITNDIGEDGADEAIIITLKNGLYAKLLVKDYINVKWLGAKGDGKTDDYIAIQKAIDNYSYIVLPAGHYRVNQDINLTYTEYKVLEGYGSLTTSIVGNTGNFVLDLTASHYIHIKNMLIDCFYDGSLDNPSHVGMFMFFTKQGEECLFNKTTNVQINLGHQIIEGRAEGSIGMYGMFEESTHVGLAILANTPLVICNTNILNLQSRYLKEGDSFLEAHSASVNTFAGETRLVGLLNTSYACILCGTHGTSFQNLYLGTGGTTDEIGVAFKCLDSVSDTFIQCVMENRKTLMEIFKNCWLRNATIKCSYRAQQNNEPVFILNTEDMEIPRIQGLDFTATSTGNLTELKRNFWRIDGSTDSIVMQESSNVKTTFDGYFNNSDIIPTYLLKYVTNVKQKFNDCTIEINRGIIKIKKLAPKSIGITNTVGAIFYMPWLKDRTDLGASMVRVTIKGTIGSYPTAPEIGLQYYADFKGTITLIYDNVNTLNKLPSNEIDCALENIVSTNPEQLTITGVKMSSGLDMSQPTAYNNVYFRLQPLATGTGVSYSSFAILNQEITIETILNQKDDIQIKLS